MTNRERVLNQILGREIDRVPLMGGWFHGVDNLARLANMSAGEYLQDPVSNLIRANEGLGVDCMISPLVPMHLSAVRTDHVLQSDFRDVTPEHLLELAERIPDTEKAILDNYDLDAAEAQCRAEIEVQQASMGEIEWIPTFWEITPAFELFGAQALFANSCCFFVDIVNSSPSSGFL